MKYIKKNKLLKILLIITILTVLISIYLTATIDKSTKEEITNNIITLKNTLKTSKVSNLGIFTKTLSNNLITTSIIWLLGISIIGIPIVLGIYLFKVLLLSLEIIFFIINIKYTNIFFIIIYLLPSILNIFLYFILLYYSINYSIILIKVIFLKKDYKLKLITKRYIKILIFVLISMFISSLIEILLIPRILIFLI